MLATTAARVLSGKSLALSMEANSPQMMYLEELPQYRNVISSNDIIEVSDTFGQLKSTVYLQIFGCLFRLGCLEIDGSVKLLSKSAVILDSRHQTVFYVKKDGIVFVIDVEDKRYTIISDKFVIYSDSGLIVLGDEVEHVIDFHLLGEYHLRIDFSKLEKEIVIFEMGSGQEIHRSIEDLSLGIGRNLLPSKSSRAEPSEIPVLVDVT